MQPAKSPPAGFEPGTGIDTLPGDPSASLGWGRVLRSSIFVKASALGERLARRKRQASAQKVRDELSDGWIVSIPIKYRNCSFRIVGYQNFGGAWVDAQQAPPSTVPPCRENTYFLSS